MEKRTLQSQNLKIWKPTKIATLLRTAVVNEHWNTYSDSHETSVQYHWIFLTEIYIMFLSQL